jgi:hypothetical protein
MWTVVALLPPPVAPAFADVGSSDSNNRFRFGQLSGGLQIILILILIGSCSGASDNAVTENGVDDEVNALRRTTGGLHHEIRELRREVRRLERRTTR